MERILVSRKYRGKSSMDFGKLQYLKMVYKNKGWKIPKWMEFVHYCLDKDYEVERYAAKTTESNYITVYHENKSFKVRFSMHKANRQMEFVGDSDFYVGKTVNGFQSTKDAIKALDYYMETGKIYTIDDLKNACYGRK